jgi:hypothetical protein
LLAYLAAVTALLSADVAATPTDAPRPIVPLDPTIEAPIVQSPYLHTTLEMALVIAGGTVWYLRHGSDERWSRAMEWQSWRRRMFTTDEITFDADHFNTNAAGHPLDGTVFYQIARGNGFGPGASFIWAVIGSTFWEYFVEIPENPSLNDMILTPGAGAIIGEATYRLGRYFAQSGTDTTHCAGALLFAPVATLKDGPLCRARPRTLAPARLGLAVGFNRVLFNGSTTRDELALNLGAAVVSNRAYERPGDGDVIVWPGQWVSLWGDGRFGAGSVEGIWFRASSVWGGRYDRHFVSMDDETDVPTAAPARGWGVLVGLGSVFDYYLRDLPAMHDRIGSLGVAGPMFELSRRGGTYLRVSLSAQYAFAIIGSMAYREAFYSLVGQDFKTPLRDSGYYYGQGVVSAATASLDLGPVGFVADGRGAWYWSINDADPEQSTLRRDVRLSDSRIRVSGAMWTRPALAGARFGLAVEEVWRASHMLATSVHGTEMNVLGTVAFGF